MDGYRQVNNHIEIWPDKMKQEFFQVVAMSLNSSTTLEAAPFKIAVQPLTIYLINHPSKMNKTCLDTAGKVRMIL